MTLWEKKKKEIRRCFLQHSVKKNHFTYQKEWRHTFDDKFIWDCSSTCSDLPQDTVWYGSVSLWVGDKLPLNEVISSEWTTQTKLSITQMKGGDKEEQHNYLPEG